MKNNVVCWLRVSVDFVADLFEFMNQLVGFHPTNDFRLERMDIFPITLVVVVGEIVTQAGRELALDGRISPRTQRVANQEIIPVPFFKILKKFPSFKKVMLVRAKEMLA
jgi:hypothetical protein